MVTTSHDPTNCNVDGGVQPSLIIGTCPGSVKRKAAQS